MSLERDSIFLYTAFDYNDINMSACCNKKNKCCKKFKKKGKDNCKRCPKI